MKFTRKEVMPGVTVYEDIADKGQGLKISASASGITLSGQSQFITGYVELQELAKAISDAFKDHMRAKALRTE